MTVFKRTVFISDLSTIERRHKLPYIVCKKPLPRKRLAADLELLSQLLSPDRSQTVSVYLNIWNRFFEDYVN
jgi:hypothetical protein